MHSEYRQRQEAVLESIGQGTAIFCSAPPAVMHNDVDYLFRQDSDFFYLTGFNEPDAVAVLSPSHSKHRFVLFVRPKDKEKETWSGYRTGVEAAKERYGADEVYPIEKLDEKLVDYAVKADRLYYHFGHNGDFNNRILQLWQQLLGKMTKRGTGPVAIEDSKLLMQQFRRLKSPSELEKIRRGDRHQCPSPQRCPRDGATRRLRIRNSGGDRKHISQRRRNGASLSVYCGDGAKTPAFCTT